MSLLGTLFRPHTFPPASKTIAAYSYMARDRTYQHPDEHRFRSTARSVFDAGWRHGGQRVSSPVQSIEDVFIDSLVAAGRCRQHEAARARLNHAYPRREHRKANLGPKSSQRHFSTTPRQRKTAVAQARDEEEADHGITKAEYKDIVNTYGLPSDLWEQPAFTGPRSKKKNAYTLAPRLVVTPEQEDRPPYRSREILPPEDADHEQELLRFERLLRYPFGKVSHAKLWRAYNDLRSPRLRYISDKRLRNLFNHLMWTEFRHALGAKERYLALVEECVAEEVPLTVEEWSTAIDYAGRGMRKGSSTDVKQAIEYWLRMEEMGTQATHVTFNILFDVAVKAGKFALADTVYNEIRTRNLELDRYFRTSMIFYAGLKGDGDAVRKAFNDLVNAGEIVDVSTMNCVILSMMRAGEAAAAENIFLKMKALHESKFGTRGPNDWRSQRKLSKLLTKTGQRLRNEQKAHQASFFGAQFSGDDKREQIQRASPIAPNALTYRLFLTHHCWSTGDMERIQGLLNESKACGFHTHGSVYLRIFDGFRRHGGYAFTAWNPSTLEAFWQEFLDASSAPNAGFWLSSKLSPIREPGSSHYSAEIEAVTSAWDESAPEPSDTVEDEDDITSEQDRAPYFTSNMALVVLQAFYKCAGRKRMLEVSDEIKARWKDCGPQEREVVEAAIEKIIERDN